jgi:signal transduction histidine kinase
MLQWLQELTAQYGVADLLSENVLIVDDEPPNLDVLQNLLDTDYRIHLATGGVAGLRIAEDTRLDIVITDLRMPEMSGVELLQRIRRFKPDVAGILVTAYSDPPALLSAINEAHAFRYLKKPWQAEDLLAAVAEARDHVYQTRAIMRLVDLLAKRSHELGAALAELRATQEQVLHLERLSSLGRFAAGVVHDLRNGLLGMMGFANEMSEYDLPDDLIEAAQLSLGSLKNLLGQLESIYQYARSNRMEVELDRVEPGDVIDSALKIVRMDLKSRTRNIERRIEPRLKTFRGDRLKLVQVLVNLLRNAVQATGDRQSIWVEAGSKDGNVLFAIEDEGSGIPPEIRPHLFGAFASNKRERGMGMGLYMSKLIVEAHRGQIDCTDRAGGGTRFEIRIPIETGCA